MITTVLFDLDGTLLPLDQEVFVKTYVTAFAKRMSGCGYPPNAFGKALMKSVDAVSKNEGQASNEEVIWKVFISEFGEGITESKEVMEDFYRTEFEDIKFVCGYNPRAAETVRNLKSKGYRTVLATMPCFPRIATEARMRWAGLSSDDFEYITTYENSKSAKPNLAYYKELCTLLGVAPESCLMVGNDVIDDMSAEKLGMKVFLLTDCLYNRENSDISRYDKGGFDELEKFIQTLEKAADQGGIA